MDVSQSVQKVLVPVHLVNAGAKFHFCRLHIVVDLLESVPLQHAGDDGAKLFRLRLVPLLPGQDIGLRERIHGIGVLGYNHVVQPGRPAGKAAVLSDFAVLPALEGVAHLPPVFGGNHPVLQLLSGCAVSFQHLPPFAHLLLANRLSVLLAGIHLSRRQYHAFLLSPPNWSSGSL